MAESRFRVEFDLRLEHKANAGPGALTLLLEDCATEISDALELALPAELVSVVDVTSVEAHPLADARTTSLERVTKAERARKSRENARRARGGR